MRSTRPGRRGKFRAMASSSSGSILEGTRLPEAQTEQVLADLFEASAKKFPDKACLQAGLL